MQVIDTLNKRKGFNPGRAFLDWVTGLLDREGIRSLADLRTRMNRLPQGLRQRDGTKLDTPVLAGVRLAIVTADALTETKVISPDNVDLYFTNPVRITTGWISI